jgi:DNA gyrase subunit A
VALIRNSESAAKAKIGLMERYGLDDEQAKAILDMKLQRLANLEAIKVNKEFDENAVEIDRLGNILGSQDEVNKLLIAALREVATKFGDARRTQLMNLSEQVQEIEEEEVTLSVSGNTIKVVKRGVKDCFKTTNLSTLLFVTNQGKMYHVPVSSVIEAGSTKIATLIKDNAPIVYYGDLEQTKLNKFWMFATSDGMIKKSNIKEYNYYGRNGTKMLKLRENSTVIACGVFTSNCETFTIPRGNSKVSVKIDIVNPTGKAAMGSKVFKE